MIEEQVLCIQEYQMSNRQLDLRVRWTMLQPHFVAQKLRESCSIKKYIYFTYTRVLTTSTFIVP